MKLCTKCGHKLILGKTCIEFIEPNSESYEADEAVELEEINCAVWLELHYCPNCEIIHDIWDDDEKHLVE